MVVVFKCRKVNWYSISLVVYCLLIIDSLLNLLSSLAWCNKLVMITKDECNSATVLLYSAHLRIFVNGVFLLFFPEVLITVQLERFLFDLVRYKNSIEMENWRMKYEIDPFLNITDLNNLRRKMVNKYSPVLFPDTQKKLQGSLESVSRHTPCDSY